MWPIDFRNLDIRDNHHYRHPERSEGSGLGRNNKAIEYESATQKPGCFGEPQHDGAEELWPIDFRNLDIRDNLHYRHPERSEGSGPDRKQ